MKFLYTIFLTVLFLIFPLKVISQDVDTICTGIYIKSLKISNKDGNANIDFYYWYRFKLPKDITDIKNYCDFEYVNGDSK
jgi:hypothetical protein